MSEIVLEGKISCADGTFRTTGPIIKLPKPPRGPFIGSDTGKEIGIISRRLESLSTGKSNRIKLALQLMNEGSDKLFGFYEYLTALEVVCNGRAGKIKSILAKIYDEKSHNEISRILGFTELAKWRHDFIHKGVKPDITPDIERYMQLLFLDLLRYESGLSSGYYVASVINTTDYDFSPLGLDDNRTEDQKRKHNGK